MLGAFLSNAAPGILSVPFSSLSPEESRDSEDLTSDLDQLSRFMIRNELTEEK
jgi:hypothetical protein